MQPANFVHTLLFLTFVKKHLRALGYKSLRNLQTFLLVRVLELSCQSCVFFRKFFYFVHLIFQYVKLLHFLQGGCWLFDDLNVWNVVLMARCEDLRQICLELFVSSSRSAEI